MGNESRLFGQLITRELNMKRIVAIVIALIALIGAQGCATIGGAAAGAGIASLCGGDAKTGAVIGGSVGAVVDILD